MLTILASLSLTYVALYRLTELTKKPHESLEERLLPEPTSPISARKPPQAAIADPAHQLSKGLHDEIAVDNSTGFQKSSIASPASENNVSSRLKQGITSSSTSTADASALDLAKSNDSSQNTQQQQQPATTTIWIMSNVMKGRLGNNMFQYASALGIFLETRERNRDKPHIQHKFCAQGGRSRKKFANLLQTFQGPLAQSCQGNPPPIAFNETGYGIYTEFPTTSCPDDTPHACAYFFTDFLISFKYFQRHAENIKQVFRFKESLDDQVPPSILEVFERESREGGTLVGIHVRRGDMMRDESYRKPTAAFYEKAMDTFRQRHGRVHFILASDFPKWCRRQAVFRKDTTVLQKTDNPAVDLMILARCRHMIISVGTFGWWAGWLAGGDVIYSKHAFDMNHTKHRDVLKLEDYYPPNWTALD